MVLIVYYIRERFSNYQEDIKMTKTLSLSSIGLLVLLLAGNVFAAAPTALVNTTWTGDITSITTSGVETPPPNPFSLTFTFESSDLSFLSGTFTAGSAPVPFSAIRDGRTLSITSVGYIIHAEISGGGMMMHRRGTTPPPATMMIKGKNVTDGSMFEGVLTKQ